MAAMRKVLTNYELLEAVLASIPPDHIRNIRLVCKDWLKLYRRSQLIQKARIMRPTAITLEDNSTALAYPSSITVRLNERPGTVPKLWRKSAKWQDARLDDGTETKVFGPILPSYFLPDVRIDDARAIRPTYPPMSAIEVRYGDTGQWHTVSCETGVTFGRVVEALSDEGFVEHAPGWLYRSLRFFLLGEHGDEVGGDGPVLNELSGEV